MDKSFQESVKINDSNDISDLIEKDQKSNTITKRSEISTTPTSTKINLIKKEITVDQSPLEEIKFNSLDSNHSDLETKTLKDNNDQKKLELNNETNLNDSLYQNRELRLTICEKNKPNNLNRSFKLLIDDLMLSISPFITFQMPYLLVETLNDPLKSYLPKSYMNYLKSNILLQDCQDYVSSKTSSSSSLSNNNNNNNNTSNSNKDNNESLHEFLLLHLTKSLNDEEIKKIYADYKSRGGIAANNNNKRLMLANIESNKADSNTKITKNNNQKQSISSSTYDCLDLYNRQHLAVLFCTQCETSPVYPNMCHKPKIVDMKFYGENDMTLGSFLAKNCFRNGYKCNNESCDTLIVFHTRSFVHADSKITVRMSVVPTANQNNQSSVQSSNNNQNAQLNLNTSRSSTNKDDTNNSSFSNLNVSALTATYSSTSKLTNNQKSQSSLANNQASILSIQSLVSSTIPSSQPPAANSQNKDNSLVANNSNNNQQQTQNFVYDDINIFMWSVCKICNKSTKKIPMAPDTWSYSLAKFLELTFHAKNYTQFNNDDENKCKHSLFQDHYQYFRFKNIVTVFSTSKITIRTLNLPIVVLKSNVLKI